MNGPGQGDLSPLTVTSPDLAGGTFPREFTCDGANRLPRLQWSTPPSGIRELVGLPEGAEVVAYCHSGSRSALATLALRAAGYDARNYACSWHEWSRHDELPLER